MTETAPRVDVQPSRSAAQPLVSVALPVFNGERYLGACLESILGQGYPRLEVVISDHGSTDRSVEIARSFADPRLTVLPTPGEGLDMHGNWARALEAASGDMVKIMGQDDLLLPGCLEVQVDLLERHPGAVLACGRRTLVDDQGGVLIRSRGLGRFAKGGTVVLPGGTLARACARAGVNLIGEPVSVLVRRDALPSPLFDPRWTYTIDMDHYFRCLGSREAVLDNRTVCCFRVSPHQLSAALARSQAEEIHAFFADIARRYPDDVSTADVRRGMARTRLLAHARRFLYWRMKTRAARAGRRVGGAGAAPKDA